jgi:hypothetical protein
MNLKSFGCSLIFGSELHDVGRNGLYANGSNFTWPAIMAKHYGYTYNTYARPGAGNLQIFERMASQLAGTINTDTLCVIGWSFTDRFDYCIKNSPWPGMPWATIIPIDEDDRAIVYYRDLHSELRDKLTSLMYIKLAIDLLKEKKIPFIMTYMDHLLFDTRWNTTPAVTDLQDYVKPYMTTFDGLNFGEWSRKNNFPVSKIGHPLEQAHQVAAEYMIKLFDTKSIGAHCHLS